MKYQNRKLVTVHLVCVSIALCRCSSVPEEASRGIKSSTYTNSDIVEKDNSQCNITVQEEGANIFRGTLRKREPDFVQFKIKQIGNERHHENENVFQPFRWSWTYNDVAGPYPFISLNLDYGILSFHLLETKSLYLEHEIGLNVSDGCNITYGSYMTTKKIVEAFISLIHDPTTDDPPTYIESYFCQYQIDQSVFKPVTYILAQYFPTTVNPIIYNCTSVYYNYTSKRFVVKPSYIGHLPSKNHWVEGASLTQLMGILALLYCSPIIVFSIAGWMAKYEKIFPNEADEEYEVIGEPFEVVSCEVDQSADWIYSDGKNNPLNVSDIFSLQRLGLSAKYPILVGRLRRLIFVLLVPSFIIIKICMYSQGIGMWCEGDKITVNMTVHRGLPVGFLSMLGDPDQRRKVFAYCLGGPVGVICLYFALSFLFIVLPRSLKQIIEDGLPRSRSCIKSPIFLTLSETLRFSKVGNKYQTIPSGYAKANVIIKCRFFMLFALPFWQFTFATQIMRWATFCQDQSRWMRIFRCVLFPLYLVICILEICFSIVYYGVPFCSFVVIVVNGATRSLDYLKRQNRILRAVFSFRIAFMVVFFVYIIYSYIISLVFLRSLLFIARVIGYCFVAVILYPKVSFGYLFFFTVIFYYIVNLIQGFSDGYMELLISAVDLSRQMNEYNEFIYNANGHVTIYCQRINNVKDIKINNQLIDVSPDILKSIKSGDIGKVQEKNGCFGIPKALFDILVQEFRPVHCELLSLAFKAAIIFTFVTALLNVSSTVNAGPTSEISEVMHVIFIVIVGALPRLVSSLLSHRNDVQLKEIEERQIREVILRYWNDVDREMEIRVS